MPSFSDRSQKLPSSPIRKLVPYSEAAKDRGINVFHLNIGQPDIETPKEFFDAITNANLKVLAYSHSAGNESLREQIAGYYTRLGHSVSTEQVLVTTGASEALNFVLTAMLDQATRSSFPNRFMPITFRFHLVTMVWSSLLRPVSMTISRCHPSVLSKRKSLRTHVRS